MTANNTQQDFSGSTVKRDAEAFSEDVLCKSSDLAAEDAAQVKGGLKGQTVRLQVGQTNN